LLRRKQLLDAGKHYTKKNKKKKKKQKKIKKKKIEKPGT